ncbi:MAG: ATP-binding protein, partial [Bacteroidota bacterium]
HPRLQFLTVVYNLLFHVLALSYVAFYPPLLSPIDIPLDEVLIFIVCLGWLYALFNIHKNEKNELIENLRAKNQALQETTEELERFTYSASHDLKSPLRTIVSFVGLIEKNIQLERYQDLEEHLSFVKSGAKQMDYLIRDILELSQMKSGQKQEYQSIDLNLILKKVKTNLKEDIQSNGALLIAESLPHYCCNESEFLLLFQNIIQNGIKYNENKIPTVRIWAEHQEDQIHIHFKDNGIGIPKEFHEKIFQFFQRLHTNNQYTGTGLGLGLCKKIVKKYKGQILVDSIINGGTTFTIELPLQSSVAPTRKENQAANTTV